MRNQPEHGFEPPPSDEMKETFDKAVEKHAKGTQKPGETPLAEKDWGAEYDKAAEDQPDIVLTDEQILAEQAAKEAADKAIDRALELGREDTEKAMTTFVFNERMQKELDEAAKETAELDQKLATLNAQQAELSKSMTGVASDMMKAIDGKTYEIVYVYAKSLGEINGALTKSQVEANAAREELIALIKKPLENLKKSVELKTPAPEAKSFTELTPEEFELAIKDLPMAERGAAKELMEKNEIPGVNKEELKKDAVELAKEVKDLENGYESATGKHVPGWKELEKNLAEEIGPDFESKMAVSGFKFGLKMLFKPGVRKTLREYKAKRKDWNSKKAELNDVTMAITNPKKFVETGWGGVLRAVSAGAKRSSGPKPGSAMNRKS